MMHDSHILYKLLRKTKKYNSHVIKKQKPHDMRANCKANESISPWKNTLQVPSLNKYPRRLSQHDTPMQTHQQQPTKKSEKDAPQLLKTKRNGRLTR